MAHFYKELGPIRQPVVKGVCWCPEAKLFVVQVKRLLAGLVETHGPSPCETDGLSISGTLAALYDGALLEREDREAFGILFVSEETWKKLTA